LFLFPCRRGSLINVVAHHVDDRDQDKHSEIHWIGARRIIDPVLEWSATADIEDVSN